MCSPKFSNDLSTEVRLIVQRVRFLESLSEDVRKIWCPDLKILLSFGHAERLEQNSHRHDMRREASSTLHNIWNNDVTADLPHPKNFGSLTLPCWRERTCILAMP